jgi:hypothetical protein
LLGLKLACEPAYRCLQLAEAPPHAADCNGLVLRAGSGTEAKRLDLCI